MNVNTNYSNYSNFQKQNEADDIQAQAKIAAEELEKIQEDPNLNLKDRLDKINEGIKELEDKIASESDPSLKAQYENELFIEKSNKKMLEGLLEGINKQPMEPPNKQSMERPRIRSIFDPNFNR